MVRIDDNDALERVARVEGEEWRAQQETRASNPYGFQAHLAAWRAKLGSEFANDPDVSWKDFMESPGDGALYGAGGYHRYILGEDGELRFSRFHARPEGIQRAVDAGFNLI